MNLKYEIRNSIENAIKSQNIDRRRFHEVSKYRYENIIRRFYYTFFDHKNEEYPNIKDLDLKYLWLRFRKNLKKHFVQYECEWEKYFSNMKDVIDEKEEKEYYLILDCGWVYEGYLTEICDVLLNADTPFIEDFYIISKKFEWIIYHCDDGQSMHIVKK